MPDHYTTHCTAVDLATQAAAKVMTRSNTQEATENFSPNIVGSKKIMEKHASIESVMPLEELNSMNSSDNEDNCSLDVDFNTSFTSSNTESGITEDFQDSEGTLQAYDNIQPGESNTMSESGGTMLPASVTGLTRAAAETTVEYQHAPTIEATDGTMRVATTATKPTTEATDGTVPEATATMEPTIEATEGTMLVATVTTEPTIEATNGTLPVSTATTEPTIKATHGNMQVTTAAMETTLETTGIFYISEIISLKIKELGTNSDSIPNNISCNELPNCSTPKSNRSAVESNSLNCNHKNAHLTVLEGSNTKINVPEVPQHNVLNNMLTNCSLLNTDSPRGKDMENSNHEAINKPVKRVEMYILTTGGYSRNF